jgi:predicted amidohydrolase
MLQPFADLFCELYDALDTGAFRRDVEAWSANSALDSLSTTIASDLEACRTTPDALRLRLNNQGEPGEIAFAVLRALDRAFAHVNPMLAGVPPAGLAASVADVQARGRLDSGAHGGALLPRLVHRQDPAQLPDHPREAFTSVVRVGAAAWDACDYERLPGHAIFHRHELLAGIKVACCPFIADPDELSFAVDDRSGRHFYRIGPRDHAPTLARVQELIDTLDASGAQIAVLPELTLTPALLERWQTCLRCRDHRGSRLLWVLAGTGNLGAGARPSNTAVLLDGRSGQELARQDKIFPFNFDASALLRWKLTGRLGRDPVDEDLEPGQSLTILDAGGMRVAIQICEDLSRAADFAGHVRDFGVSHVIVPVFDRPLRDRRWERAASDVHAKATGSTVVVANSLVMHTVLGGDPGVGLVVWPNASDALVASAARPGDIACFRLLPDGTATSC